MRLKAYFTPAFRRDLEKLDKRHVDDRPLREVLVLIYGVDRASDPFFLWRHLFSMHDYDGILIDSQWQLETSERLHAHDLTCVSQC